MTAPREAVFSDGRTFVPIFYYFFFLRKTITGQRFLTLTWNRGASEATPEPSCQWRNTDAAYSVWPMKNGKPLNIVSYRIRGALTTLYTVMFLQLKFLRNLYSYFYFVFDKRYYTFFSVPPQIPSLYSERNSMLMIKKKSISEKKSRIKASVI